MTGICTVVVPASGSERTAPADADMQANPINLRGIDHVVLRTAQLPAMVAFYRDVLGCRLERGPGALGLAQLRAGQSLIDIVTLDGPVGGRLGGDPVAANANMDHFCLAVVPWDEAAILDHLARHGIAHDGVAQRYGARGSGPSIYFSDPDGNRVELAGA
jgi:catechol 2,3-dioxygenase-like lactoylglutathione lyase family enzyme